jgi:hypothetical protein
MYRIPTINEKQYRYGILSFISEYKKSLGEVVFVYIIVEVYKIKTIKAALKAKYIANLLIGRNRKLKR